MTALRVIGSMLREVDWPSEQMLLRAAGYD